MATALALNDRMDHCLINVGVTLDCHGRKRLALSEHISHGRHGQPIQFLLASTKDTVPVSGWERLEKFFCEANQGVEKGEATIFSSSSHFFVHTADSNPLEEELQTDRTSGAWRQEPVNLSANQSS